MFLFSSHQNLDSSEEWESLFVVPAAEVRRVGPVREAPKICDDNVVTLPSHWQKSDQKFQEGTIWKEGDDIKDVKKEERELAWEQKLPTL